MRTIKPYLVFALLLNHAVQAEPTLEHIKTLNTQGEYQQAIQEADDYLKHYPQDGDVTFFKANALYHLDKYAEAEKVVSQLLEQYPQYEDALLLKIDIKIKQQQYESANTLIQQSLEKSPQNAKFLEKQQQLLAIHKKPQEAKPAVYKEYRDLYNHGDKQTAIAKAQSYLKDQPHDGDVILVLGQMLNQEHQYQKAHARLKPAVKEFPDYLDLRVELIKSEMGLKKYSQALAEVNLGLKQQPKNKVLMKKKKDILYLLKPKSKKAPPKKSPAVENEPRYKNEVGVLQQNYYISDVHQVWNYTSLYYGHETSLGKLFGRVNYANRFHKDAPQFEMEFFPKLNKYIYLDLTGAVANQPILFPHYMYAGEAYFMVPKLFDISGGGQFNRIDALHQYSRFTTSIAKSWHEHTLLFRPFFYSPGRGPSSILYTLNYRYTFLEPYGYWGIVLGTGSTPDLADLQTVDFLKLQNKIVNPYLNFALLHEQLNINIGLLYQNQVFPSQRIRNWWGGILGVAWRY